MLVDLINQYSADQLTATTKDSSGLGKDAFLQLLVAQMKNQDPLDPLKNEDFIAQLAQFNSLEQMMNLNQTFSTSLGFQALSYASTLIGKEVVWTGSDNTNQSGVVEGVEMIDSKPTLIIGDQAISMTDVNAVYEAL